MRCAPPWALLRFGSDAFGLFQGPGSVDLFLVVLFSVLTDEAAVLIPGLSGVDQLERLVVGVLDAGGVVKVAPRIAGPRVRCQNRGTLLGDVGFGEGGAVVAEEVLRLPMWLQLVDSVRTVNVAGSAP